MVIRPSINNPVFYQRPSVQLARDIPGELMATAAGNFAVTIVEGYSGLPRPDMDQSFARKVNRQPGEICVTAYRGNPQLNVVGYDLSGAPQLTWIREAVQGDDDFVANPGLIKAVAKEDKWGGTLIDSKAVLDYAVRRIDGMKLHDRDALIRLIENQHPPYSAENVAFLEHTSGAKNLVGIGVLSEPVMMGNDALNAILESEAKKLKMSLAELISAFSNPSKAVDIIKKSKVLRRIIQRLQYLASQSHSELAAV